MATTIKKENIAALNWFLDHKGYSMSLDSKEVKISAGEILIRSRACGIFKPELV